MNGKSALKLVFAALLLLCAAVLFCACGKSAPEFPEVPGAAGESGEELYAAEPAAEPAEETPEPEPSREPFVEPEAEFVHGVPEVTGYESEVCPGQLRYVSQLKDLRKNGWGRFEARAGSECTTACISMALSCIGIDESPEKLLTFSTTTVFASSYGIKTLEPSPLTGAAVNAEEGYKTFLLMLENYLDNRDWTVSPVLLYLAGNGNRHGILIIGAEEDCFLVVDPAARGIHRISISEKGEISSGEGKEYLMRYTDSGKVKAKISALAQWSVIPEPEEQEEIPEKEK